MQVSLLRVLETKRVRRVGGTALINATVRVIAATNKDLWREVLSGKFREDLLFRLEVFTINLPPLRERQEDIPLLGEYFLHMFNKEHRRKIHKVSTEAMEILLSYSWVGNVRGLQNTTQRAILVCEGDVITPDHLPPRLS
jgi:DNA-binding NtrC family response regulator